MIAIERIAALCCGDLDATETDAVEQHLLDCDLCSLVADRLASIGRGVTRIVMQGLGRGIVTSATAERLRTLGVPIGEYRIAPGASVRCQLVPDDVFNMVTFELPPSDASRIDCLLLDANGSELERSVDVAFDRTRNTVTLIESRERLQSLPTTKLTVRLLVVEQERARVLAEYVLDHQARFD